MLKILDLLFGIITISIIDNSHLVNENVLTILSSFFKIVYHLYQ